MLKPGFDHILVDCGSRLDPRTLWMLEQADAHIFVIFPEIAALRATTLMLGFLSDGDTARGHPSRRQSRLPQRAAQDPRRGEPAQGKAGGRDPVYRGRHHPGGQRGRTCRLQPPQLARVAGHPGARRRDRGGGVAAAHEAGGGRPAASGRAAPGSSLIRDWCRRRGRTPTPPRAAEFKPAASAIPPLRPFGRA